MNIKDYITEISKKLNIDIIGFTDAEPLSNLEEYLQFRIDNNLATGFEEKDLEKRLNPKKTMPNCKSIIVIGISYNTGYKPKPDFEIKGSLSKSTWGLDYHKVLKEKMIELIDKIKVVKEFEYNYFVDTGPLVDRELANKAGIGYYGKNCNIINNRYGSFIFLGYILTDINMMLDNTPSPSECGECNLCISACPTGALEAPYKLNPKRCISYLTQTKDNIDILLREKMGIKIYGCDTCQMVCPKNKGVEFSSHQDFIPYKTNGCMDIKELLNISNKEFKAKYGHMSGSWRGKNVLKRNAIIALGNMKDNKHISLIQDVLEENNQMFNQYALWALQQDLLKNI